MSDRGTGANDLALKMGRCSFWEEIRGGARSYVSRALAYVTNHGIAHVPSLTVRAVWYRNIVGIPIGRGSAVDLNCYIWFFGPGQVRRSGNRIGRDTMINRGCCLDIRGQLTIGDSVNISPDVAIITTQHRFDAPGFPLERRGVSIEDYAWIGMRALLLPGAVVGRGAVVAAGSVVRGIVPAMSVVAGNPAVVVATRPEDALGYRLDEPTPMLA